jgi:uncharacterized membrane protein
MLVLVFVVQIVFYKIWKTERLFLDSWLVFLVLWLLWTSMFLLFQKYFAYLYASYYCSIMFLMVLVEDFTKHFMYRVYFFRRSSLLPTLPFCYRQDFYMNSDKYILEQLMVKKENTNLPIYY